MERRGWQDKAGCKVTPAVHSNGVGVSQAFIWLKVRAKDTNTLFNNLLHQISVPILREAFRSLGKSKAKGVDGITKTRYGENLEANLADLHARIHENRYRTSPARVIHIPKANGKTRPIAISTIEDKIVQRATAMILEVVYEPIFLDSSMGFRPKRGCHKAIHRVCHLLKDGHRPVVMDVDIDKFFNSMSHKRMMEFLGRKIIDRRFLHLVGKQLRTMIREDGLEVVNEVGSPQGSIISPILANIYLHYVLDEWFEANETGHHQKMVRYADDVIFCFRSEDKAREFRQALQKRLEDNGLKLNEAKTRIVPFEKGTHEAFHFLGFTFYWGKDKKQNNCLKVKTQAEKLRMKVAEMKAWLKNARNKISLDNILKEFALKLNGHYAYYGVETNNKTWVYYNLCLKLLFKWINRRSQKRSYSWDGFIHRLKQNPLPKPFLANKLSFAQDVFAFAI